MSRKLWRLLAITAWLVLTAIIGSCSKSVDGDIAPLPATASSPAAATALPSTPEPAVSGSTVPEPTTSEQLDIAESFIQRASAPDADPSELLAALREDLPKAQDAHEADAMLRAMVAIYDDYLPHLQMAYEAAGIQQAVPFPVTETAIEAMENEKARDLVTRTIAGGFTLSANEASVFPVVDYGVLYNLAVDASEALQDYLAIQAAESEQHIAIDGGLVISREELRNRTLNTEAYLRKHTDAPEYDQVESMFEKYLTMYLLARGLPNSQVYDYRTFRVLPEVEAEWQRTAVQYPDTVTGIMSQRLLDILQQTDGLMYVRGQYGDKIFVPEVMAFEEGLLAAVKTELAKQ